MGRKRKEEGEEDRSWEGGMMEDKGKEEQKKRRV